MVRLISILFIGAVLLAILSSVEAHGKLIQPAADYFGGFGGEFSHVIKKDKVPPPPGKKWDDFSPDDVSQHILEQMKNNNIKLKDLVYHNLERSQFSRNQKDFGECGFANPAAVPKPVPDDIKWEVDAYHDSICAFFCDDEQVKPDTAKCYGKLDKPNGLTTISYDKEKCKGKKEFRFIILSSAGLPEWQAYSKLTSDCMKV